MSWTIEEAYANWVGANHWDHFVTLTFAFPTSIRTASKHGEDGFLRDLGRRAGRSVNYFGAIEGGPSAERTHVHLVLEGTHSLAAATIARAWRRGIAEVQVFTSHLPGLSYISKTHSESDAPILIRDKRLSDELARQPVIKNVPAG